MTNNERQAQLDKEKYIASEKLNMDMSGSMQYCRFCPYKANSKCQIEHEDRLADNTCAKAYNKYYKMIKR